MYEIDDAVIEEWGRHLPTDPESPIYKEFWYLDAIRRLFAERTWLKAAFTLAKLLVARTPMCQDHRDKFKSPRCLACDLEQALLVMRNYYCGSIPRTKVEAFLDYMRRDGSGNMSLQMAAHNVLAAIPPSDLDRITASDVGSKLAAALKGVPGDQEQTT